MNFHDGYRRGAAGAMAAHPEVDWRWVGRQECWWPNDQATAWPPSGPAPMMSKSKADDAGYRKGWNWGAGWAALWAAFPAEKAAMAEAEAERIGRRFKQEMGHVMYGPFHK